MTKKTTDCLFKINQSFTYKPLQAVHSMKIPLFQKGSYRILAFVFDDYETLDLHGPIEMLGHMPRAELRIVGKSDVIRSYQDTQLLTDNLITQTYDCDLFIIPGGIGTRQLIHDITLSNWLTAQVLRSKQVFTICTGSALLAMTSLLNHHKATTNKMAFQWVTSLNKDVFWQPKARWVLDNKFLTASGVSAGIDAALFWVSQLHGEDEAQRIAHLAEYQWSTDSTEDPFAVFCHK